MRRLLRISSIFLFLCIFSLYGCKTTYVPVESTHTDTLYVSNWQRDSVYIEILKHDSVTIQEKGDTVFVHRWHTEYRDRWIDREIRDTLYISKTDSIRVPYPVEKKLTAWQRLRMNISSVFVSICFFVVIIAIIWLVKMKGKRF